MMNEIEQYKQQAAEAALSYVQSGMVLGLGTGSTARYVLHGLAARLGDGRLAGIAAVPTSEATAAQAQHLGIPLVTLATHPQLDLAIDGADEIDPQLNLIKGLGGAMLREKIVAAAAQRFLVIADSSKLVAQLGERAPVPVEVIPFGQAVCAHRLSELGAEPVLRRTADGAPLRTDEGNVILDCRFAALPDPAVLNVAIKAIPGVVDHGMFLDLAAVVLVAGPTGIATLVRG